MPVESVIVKDKNEMYTRAAELIDRGFTCRNEGEFSIVCHKRIDELTSKVVVVLLKD